MKTEELIDLLAQAAPSVQPARAWRILAPVLPVALLVLTLVLLLWRVQPDLMVVASTLPFQVKMLWLVVLMGIGLWALWRLAHPGAAMHRMGHWGGPVVLGSMALPAFSQSLGSPAAQQSTLWLGQSWWMCLLSLGFLSLPLLVVLLWTLRRMAPTRPAQAGAMAGWVAASIAAMAYSLHCPETGYGFYLLWYGGSLLAMSALGAWLGRRWLRW